MCTGIFFLKDQGNQISCWNCQKTPLPETQIGRTWLYLLKWSNRTEKKNLCPNWTNAKPRGLKHHQIMLLWREPLCQCEDGVRPPPQELYLKANGIAEKKWICAQRLYFSLFLISLKYNSAVITDGWCMKLNIHCPSRAAVWFSVCFMKIGDKWATIFSWQYNNPMDHFRHSFLHAPSAPCIQTCSILQNPIGHKDMKIFWHIYSWDFPHDK